MAAVSPELFSGCVGAIPALCVFVLGQPGGAESPLRFLRYLLSFFSPD